jgi:hypothetical protein
MAVSINPEELLEISNQNLEGACNYTFAKQREIVVKIFSLEKQSEGWSNSTNFKGYEWKFKQFEVHIHIITNTYLSATMAWKS